MPCGAGERRVIEKARGLASPEVPESLPDGGRNVDPPQGALGRARQGWPLKGSVGGAEDRPADDSLAARELARAGEVIDDEPHELGVVGKVVGMEGPGGVVKNHSARIGLAPGREVRKAAHRGAGHCRGAVGQGREGSCEGGGKGAREKRRRKEGQLADEGEKSFGRLHGIHR